MGKELKEFDKFSEGLRLMREAGFNIKDAYVSSETLVKIRLNTFVSAEEFGYDDPGNVDGMFMGIRLHEEN